MAVREASMVGPLMPSFEVVVTPTSLNCHKYLTAFVLYQ